MNELYKSNLISKDFQSIEDYFQAWSEMEKQYYEKVSSKEWYQVWVDFTSKKFKEGCLWLYRNINLKNEIQAKNKDLEYNHLKSLIQIKEEDDQNHEMYEKEIE